MFHCLAAAVAGLTLLCASDIRAASPPVDLMVVNAAVRTMDPNHPQAAAVAVRAGRIAEVGDTAAIRRLAGPKTKVIDAHGRVVLPGFIDAHLHPQPLFDEMGPYGALDLTPDGGATSREAFLAKIRAKVAATPEGQPIYGSGYNDTLIGGYPTAKELDLVSPRNPLVLTHASGHRQVGNSLALKLAGIDRNTKDPDGGKIVRGPDGEATGEVLEKARNLFSPLAKMAPAPTREARVAAMRKQFQAFAAEGLTSVGIAGTWPEDMGIYRELVQSGMPVRIYAMVREEYLDWWLANRDKPEWRVDGLTIRTIKVYHGNSLSGRTAWLYEPYANDPTYYGIAPPRKQEQLNAIIQRIHDAGLEIAVHSNGDREIDMVLTAFEAAQAKTPRQGTRHRIEHASVVNQRILDRIKRDGVYLAPHSYILNLGQTMEEFGEARWPWMHPNKRALDMGIPIGGTSDYPVSPAIPMQRIQSLVTRRAKSNGKVYGDGQQLTMDQAIRDWTMGSATLQFEENEKGSLTPGKLGDLVILSADPYRTDPLKIETIKVDTTIIGGKVVFERSGAR
jgi:predicted amidohydrolase YtcJ